MWSERSTATSRRMLAKFSLVMIAPSTLRINVGARNCGMYWRMPRRSVSFTFDYSFFECPISIRFHPRSKSNLFLRACWEVVAADVRGGFRARPRPSVRLLTSAATGLRNFPNTFLNENGRVGGFIGKLAGVGDAEETMADHAIDIAAAFCLYTAGIRGGIFTTGFTSGPGGVGSLNPKSKNSKKLENP